VSTQLNMRDGKYWLEQLEGALVPVVTFQALNRYGQVPDVEDRIGDALSALADGAARFLPQPGKDSVGYFLQYTLSHVAGSLRNGAQTAKDWAAEAATFTDLSPDDLGLEAVWEMIPATADGEEPEETLFVTKSGKVADKMELLAMACDEQRGPMVARLLGVQIEDPRFKVAILEALDNVEEQLRADPRWIEDVPAPEPVVVHDLKDILVVRNGVQTVISAAEVAVAVEEASRNAAVWSDGDDEEFYETDSPWEQWKVDDATRSYHSPSADDAVWPDSVTRKLWTDAIAAWSLVGWADDVLTVLEGTFSSDTGEVVAAVEATIALGEALAGEPEGSARTVARTLANKVHALGVHVKAEDGQTPQESLYERLCWQWGTDGTTEWVPDLPSADGLRFGIQGWVERVKAARGVWKSQGAAIEALVLHDASPSEAKKVARAAFNSR